MMSETRVRRKRRLSEISWRTLFDKDDMVVTSWCLYDVGNSAFATTIMAAILPVYFREVVATGLTGTLPTAYWGYASAIALLLSAVLAPFIGTVADIRQSKKRILVTFTMIGSIATSGLAFMGAGDWKCTLFLMIIGTIGFSGSIICYDSLLPHIVTVDRINYTSAKGYALGYLGGGILLGFNLILIRTLSGTMGPRISFFSVSLWWLIFTIPLIVHIKEPSTGKPQEKGTSLYVSTLTRLKETFLEIRQYNELFKFLFAFWVYNDGIGTVIRMAAIYGSQLGISMNHLVGALLLTQFVGVPFSMLFGKIAHRAGAKNALYIALSWYTLIALSAVFLKFNWHFWSLAIAVGMVQGGAQAISRSMYASMVPKSRSAEFFSFYDISSKFAGIAGPAIFGIITQITGSSRFAIAALSTSFVIGMIILRKVNLEKGIEMAHMINRQVK